MDPDLLRILKSQYVSVLPTFSWFIEVIFEYSFAVSLKIDDEDLELSSS